MGNQNYYVTLYNGENEIANSKTGSLSKNDVISATSFVVHDVSKNTDIVYSTKLNKNGTLSSIDGNSVLKRTEIISLFGGQDNYNAMLSINDMKLPTTVNSLDQVTVSINGEQVKPTFMIYPDGQVYIDGLDKPISKKKLKEYFPETYKKIWGVSSLVSADGKQAVEYSKTTGGGGGSSSYSAISTTTGSQAVYTEPSAPSDSAKTDTATTPAQPTDTNPVTPTSPTSAQEGTSPVSSGPSPHSTTSATSTPTGGGSAPAGASGGSDLLVDYSGISTITSTVNSSISKLSSVLEGYASLSKIVGDGSIWDGEEISQFSQAATNFGTYFTDISAGLKELNESLNKMSELFETTEQQIGN